MLSADERDWQLYYMNVYRKLNMYQEMKRRGWQVGMLVAIRMRGQPHVRGSSTDGRNPNLIPREQKDKATSAVEWRLRRPRRKGRRRWNKKRVSRRSAHTPSKGREVQRRIHSDQTKVSSSSDVDVHPGFPFFWF